LILLRSLHNQTQKKKSVKTSGAEIVYEDDEWTVYWIKTEEASKLLGSGTTWCIAADKDNAFDGYSEFSSVYMFISKRETYETNSLFYKVAGVIGDSYGTTYYKTPKFYDTEDTEYTESEIKEHINLPDYKIKYIPLKLDDVIKDGVLKRVREPNVIDGKYTVPDSVVTIGKISFSGTRDVLKSVYIPDTVTSIDEYAFKFCRELVDVRMPSRLKFIGSGVFEGCESLKNINISDGVNITTSLFENCISLESIEIPYGVRDIFADAFYNCKSLKNVKIPDTVRDIHPEAFCYCAFREIELPPNLQIIDTNAFYYCRNLIEISIPSSTEYIGRSAFAKCESLRSVKLSEGLDEIDDFAFENCRELKELKIPKSVRKIGKEVFPVIRKTESISIETPHQEYTSKKTSINSKKLPAVFKLVKFERDSINVDIGGGKYDNANDYTKEEYNTINLVYDPYNRSKEHNDEVVRLVSKNHGADSVTCSNVLNVIKEKDVRLSVLRNCKKFLKPGKPCYITVYEGNGSGVESPTSAGYQLNRKTKEYVSEVKEVFANVQQKGQLITAY